LFGFPLPHDEGAAGSFGPNGVNTDAVTGNLEAFNIQDVINSARKRGWFHNHRAIQVSRGHHKSGKRKVIKGFENAIAFYGSDDFSGLTADTFPAIHTSLAGLESGDDGTIASFPENDGIEHLGGFLRSLGADYGLRNCERLVTEAISRIKVYVSPKLAIQHCKFELADVKRVLTESKLKPTPYKRVAQKASKLIQKMEKAAYERDIKGLKRVIRKLTRLRESIATVVVPAP
jgi:hypothetical protein